MYNSVLIKLLKTFSPEEIKEFKDFVASPFFNKRKSVVKLINKLSQDYPSFESPDLSKEKIFEHIFAGKKYNDNSIRVISHYLYELAERFIAIKKFEENKVEHCLILAEEFASRDFPKQFYKHLTDAATFIDSADIDRESFLFSKFRIENSKFFNSFKLNRGVFEKSNVTDLLENIFLDVQKFFILKTLNLYINQAVLNFNYKKQSDITAFEKIFSKINIEDFKDTPAILTYYYLSKMLTNFDDESNFYKTKQLLHSHGNKLTKLDKTGIYINLSNYCSKKIMDGIEKFEKERFDIYKEELNEKTYKFSDGTMSPVFYRNVVTTGLRLNEYEWTRKFIFDYRNELSKQFSENYFNFCLSQVEFAIKNFEASLELNSKLKYDELYLKIGSKILQIQIYFELKYIDSLMASIESFRHFLDNNKMIPEPRKIRFVNFYKYLKQIISFHDKCDANSLSQLKSYLRYEKNIAEKYWLMAKVDDNLFI